MSVQQLEPIGAAMRKRLASHLGPKKQKSYFSLTTSSSFPYNLPIFLSYHLHPATLNHVFAFYFPYFLVFTSGYVSPVLGYVIPVLVVPFTYIRRLAHFYIQLPVLVLRKHLRARTTSHSGDCWKLFPITSGYAAVYIGLRVIRETLREWSTAGLT